MATVKYTGTKAQNLKIEQAMNSLGQVTRFYTEAPSIEAEKILVRLKDNKKVDEAIRQARNMVSKQKFIINKLNFMANLQLAEER